MKFPGGNPLLFCEQVSTVTSFFEQWNDCERTVVLYALLKRVPFANLKFLQLSIDYNLAQNYSTQSKLQLLESQANNANFLNQLVQRYQTKGDGVPATTTTTTANGLTSSDSGFQDSGSKDKKSSSTFDLSGGSSASSTTSSSSTTSFNSSDPAKAGVDKNNSTAESTTSSTCAGQHESKKDILNDMLVYLPLLKPGNDDVKSVYMSLIPAAVEDACQRAVPTELVQHILSYLLIHPAVNNDDRRSLSYWLRHLEEHIASSYMTTLATPSLAAATTANNSNNNNNSSNSKLATVNNSNNNYFTQQPNSHSHHPPTAGSKPGSQQSLQFLAAASAAPWHHLHPQQNQNQNLQQAPPAIGSSSSSSLLSISNSSLLSKSQQSLNQSGGGAGPGGGGGGGGGSSTSSSSSGLDSGASQLKSGGSAGGSSANNSSSTTASTTMMVNLDWTTSTQTAEVGGEGGGKVRGSMENVTLKEFGPVTFNYSRDHHQQQQQQLASQSAAAVSSQPINGSTLSNNGTLNGSAVGATNTTSVLTDLDSSSDDNHLSFSKNGTEIFDYDCDYDNEEELYNLARAAAAAAVVAGSGVTGAAGSAMTPGGSAAAAVAVTGSGKNRVSFDANISDYLRVPPIGDLELDGSGLLKTRRSNSLTTTVGSGCGLAGVGEQLHHQQKQNNECLSAENLSQLMQNKPRSFSLTMESPRSSLTSSGSETRLDDFKQHHHMMKMYGTAPNVGMASIAHWLKSLRLHKYVWLFSNLTYEQMMEMTEEYLASLGVTKGARHKLVLCIQKLRERFALMVRLEKELLAAGSVGSKAQLGAVFEELTNIVLTPMKPVGSDSKEDIGTQFLKLLDLIASILLVRSAVSPQDEEFLNVYVWLLERAMHNEAFAGHVMQLKEYKYKANKVKMQFGGPKGGGGGGGGHYGKVTGAAGLGGGLGGSGGLGGIGGERGMQLNGNLGKPRWSVSNKHNKPCGGSSEGLQKSAPHRKSSLQYFSSPMQPPSGLGQPNPSGGSSSSSHTHLQAIPPHGYYGAGTGHNNSYNKSSSYPNFASNLSDSSKHHRGHPGPVPHTQQQVPVPPVPPPQQQQPPHVPSHGNFMYHRHSLNNISAHQHQQQFLQQLQSQQQQQQQQQLLPSIYLSTMGGQAVAKKEVPLAAQKDSQQQKSDDSGKSQNNNNNSIGDINSRLEFLCLQMTEQAIN